MIWSELTQYCSDPGRLIGVVSILINRGVVVMDRLYFSWYYLHMDGLQRRFVSCNELTVCCGYAQITKQPQ